MKTKKLIQTMALITLLFVFLSATNPTRVSLPFILIPYLLIALIIYRAMSFAFNGLLAGSVDSSKLKLYAIIITVVATNFALLKSIGQLTFQDGLISVAIIVVSVVYISKFSLSS